MPSEHTEESIKEHVRDRYGAIAQTYLGETASESCCGPGDAEPMGRSLSCGAPVDAAGLKPGQTVLDLGSGGGLDCLAAAAIVGPEGHVIGVDMTPEMVALATQNAQRMGVNNVEFRQGEIERLPVGDAEVDVVVSNCVINLSPDKGAVFAEAFRVLKPGGLLAISDIVTHGDLPPEVKSDPEAWCACVAGALEETDYLKGIQNAGFKDIRVLEKREYHSEVFTKCCPDDEEDGAAELFSITLVARKADS